VGKVDTIRAADYNYFQGKETIIINGEQDFFIHHRIVPTVKRIQ
jgi:hypothetical protein